jgi:hypothetical protein
MLSLEVKWLERRKELLRFNLGKPVPPIEDLVIPDQLKLKGRQALARRLLLFIDGENIEYLGRSTGQRMPGLADNLAFPASPFGCLLEILDRRPQSKDLQYLALVDFP